MTNQSPIISETHTEASKNAIQSGMFSRAQHLATEQVREVAERWLPVVGSERHEVSSLGHLRCWFIGKRKERLTSPVDVKPRPIAEGYLGFGKQSRLHSAVLEAFVGPCPVGHEAAHRDGNKHNNALSNLRWATHAENIADKVAHGTCRARTRPNLAPDAVEEIRRRRGAGERRSDVAADFGVTPQTISNATRGAA